MTFLLRSGAEKLFKLADPNQDIEDRVLNIIIPHGIEKSSFLIESGCDDIVQLQIEAIKPETVQILKEIAVQRCTFKSVTLKYGKVGERSANDIMRVVCNNLVTVKNFSLQIVGIPRMQPLIESIQGCSLRCIRNLDLSSSGVSHARNISDALIHFIDCNTLQYLNVSNISFDEPSLSLLHDWVGRAGCSLRRLHMVRCGLAALPVSPLVAAPSPLELLDVAQNAFYFDSLDSAFQNLSFNHALTELDISRVVITESVSHLRSCKCHLRLLMLSRWHSLLESLWLRVTCDVSGLESVFLMSIVIVFGLFSTQC